MNPVHWSYLIPALPMIAGFALTAALYWALRFTESRR
jgi:hypothetical protein